MSSTVGLALLKEAVICVSFCPALVQEHSPVIGFMKSFESIKVDQLFGL